MEQRKNSQSIGRFDVIKGLAMYLVVLWHTVPFSDALKQTYLFRFCLFSHDVFFGALIGVYFVINGYGLRNRPVKNILRQQIKIIGYPYMITAMCTVAVGFIKSVFELPLINAVKVAVKLFLGFFLALPNGGWNHFKLQYFWCGPMWFLFAMFMGNLLTIWIVRMFPEKWHWTLALGCSVIGCVINLWKNEFPFCLGYVFFCVGFIYTGYWLKTKKILSKKLPKWILWAAAADIICMIYTVYNSSSELLKLVFVHTFSGIFLSAVIVYLYFNFGDMFSSGFRMTKWIGSNSMLFMCVHTVEMLGTNAWSWFEKHTAFPLVVQFLLIFIVRMGICLGMCFLIKNRKQISEK